MNHNDINRKFTEKVNELLGQGYQICPATMNSTQGEIAHVDVYKGDEVIRVLLERTYDNGEKPDGIRIIVGRNTDRVSTKFFESLSNIIWNNDLEIISEIEFCKIEDNYYTDVENGKEIYAKQRALRRALRESGHLNG